MRHLIPLTPDQVSIVQASLQSSLKYADSEYIELVDEIMQVIEEAWNRAEELKTSLTQLNDNDLVACRQDLIDRTNRIMESLNEIGTGE